MRVSISEVEENKKWWQDTQKNYTKKKKDLHDPDNHDGVITHLGPDIPRNAKSSGS